MSDFNSDNAKLDEALGTLAQTVTGHTTALAQKGNCRIETFTYTGTGTSPCQISFTGQPLLFVILAYRTFFFGSWGDEEARAILHDPLDKSDYITGIDAAWSGYQLSLSSDNAYKQANDTGEIYRVIALYAEDA